jgi:hypothetical protein
MNLILNNSNQPKSLNLNLEQIYSFVHLDVLMHILQNLLLQVY